MCPKPAANTAGTSEVHIKPHAEQHTPALDGGEHGGANIQASVPNECVDELSDEEAQRLAEEIELACDASSIWGAHELDSYMTNCIYHQEPDAYPTYYEPFLGRGFGFWESVNERRWQTAVLSDCDVRVIRVHETIRDSSNAIIERLRSTPVSGCLEQSLQDLGAVTDEVARIARIVRFGVWAELIRMTHSDARRNLEQYVRGREESTVNSCSRILRHSRITLTQSDFADALTSAKEGDFAVLDPPRNFPIKEHMRLAKCYSELRARGVQSLVFLAPSIDVSQLYADCEVKDILGPPPKPKRGRKKIPAEVPQRPVLARVVIGRDG